MLYIEQINPKLRYLRNQKNFLNLGGNPFGKSAITPDIEKGLDKAIEQLEDLLKTAKSVYDYL